LDALGDVDGDAGDVGSVVFDLAGVEADADVETKGPQLIADRDAAADAATGSVEGCEEPVAGRFDLAAAESREFGAYQVVMSGQQISPTAITGLGQVSVDRTTSVNITVASIRSATWVGRRPVTNSSIGSSAVRLSAPSTMRSGESISMTRAPSMWSATSWLALVGSRRPMTRVGTRIAASTGRTSTVTLARNRQ
jgi:hypothetical protein